jgi:hypothetical protein
VNEPYSSGPGGEGQYTHKVYHVGRYVNMVYGSILGLDPDQGLRIRNGSGPRKSKMIHKKRKNKEKLIVQISKVGVLPGDLEAFACIF